MIGKEAVKKTTHQFTGYQVRKNGGAEASVIKTRTSSSRNRDHKMMAKKCKGFKVEPVLNAKGQTRSVLLIVRLTRKIKNGWEW